MGGSSFFSLWTKSLSIWLKQEDHWKRSEITTAWLHGSIVPADGFRRGTPNRLPVKRDARATAAVFIFQFSPSRPFLWPWPCRNFPGKWWVVYAVRPDRQTALVPARCLKKAHASCMLRGLSSAALMDCRCAPNIEATGLSDFVRKISATCTPSPMMPSSIWTISTTVLQQSTGCLSMSFLTAFVWIHDFLSQKPCCWIQIYWRNRKSGCGMHVSDCGLNIIGGIFSLLFQFWYYIDQS